MRIAMNTAVMEHDERQNGNDSGRVSDWFETMPQLGKKLTDEEAEKLAAYSGYRLLLPLDDYAASYLLDDASGVTVHVYTIDPLQ